MSVFTSTIDVRRLTDAADAGVDPGESHRLHPRPGTPAHADLLRARQLQPPCPHGLDDECSDLLLRLIASGTDQLGGLAALLEHSHSLRPGITAARSASEAWAKCGYLIDDQADERERLRRYMNFRFLELAELRRADPLDQLRQERIDDLARAAHELGFETRTIEQKFARSPKNPYVDAPVPRQNELVKRLIGESLMWRPTSAIAHALDSPTLLMLDPLVGLDTDDAQRRAKDLAFHAIEAVMMFTQVVPRLEWYLGWDLSDCRGQFDLLLRQWYVGAGLADDQIHQTLFGS